MSRLQLPILIAIAALAACGPLDENEVGDPSDRTTYPEGPYGTKQGAVIADLSFLGTDGEPFTLGDVFADEKNRVLILASAAGWCSPCIQEQRDLTALHKKYASRGLVIMGAIFQDKQRNKATVEYAKRWKSDYQKDFGLPYHIVADSDFVLGPFFSGDDPTPPLNIVVNVDDMKILLVTTDYNEAVITALLESHLPKK